MWFLQWKKFLFSISLVFNFEHAIALAFESGSAVCRLNRARQTWLPQAPLEAVRKKIHKSNYFCRIASIFHYLWWGCSKVTYFRGISDDQPNWRWSDWIADSWIIRIPFKREVIGRFVWWHHLLTWIKRVTSLPNDGNHPQKLFSLTSWLFASSSNESWQLD